MSIGVELCPFHAGIKDAALLGDDGKFLFPAQVVTDVMVLDNCFTLMARLFDKDSDGNGSPATRAKDFSTFPSRSLSARPLVPTQIEDINSTEFIFQAFAETVHRIAIQPSCICDKCDYSSGFCVNSI